MTMSTAALSLVLLGSTRSLAVMPLIFSKGSALTVGYNLATVLSAASPDMETTSFMYRFLQLFTNVFYIWMLYLMAVGFSLVHSLSSGKAWAAALIPWTLGNLLSLALMMFFM